MGLLLPNDLYARTVLPDSRRGWGVQLPFLPHRLSSVPAPCTGLQGPPEAAEGKPYKSKRANGAVNRPWGP